MIDLLKFSEEAVVYIKSLIKKKGTIGLSVDAVQGGCSGMRFLFALENSIPEKSEVIKIDETCLFFIKPAAYLFVVGSRLDCLKTATGKRLIFQKANYKKQCSCGQSFF